MRCGMWAGVMGTLCSAGYSGWRRSRVKCRGFAQCALGRGVAARTECRPSRGPITGSWAVGAAAAGLVRCGLQWGVQWKLEQRGGGRRYDGLVGCGWRSRGLCGACCGHPCSRGSGHVGRSQVGACVAQAMGGETKRLLVSSEL